jgi:hypothetical protein
MKKRKIALYSNSVSPDVINKIKDIKQILSQSMLIEDFIIFTRDLLSYRPQHYSIFYDFYSTFYDGDIVFIDKSELLEKYDFIKTDKKNIYFYGNINNDMPNHIDVIYLSNGENNEKL